MSWRATPSRPAPPVTSSTTSSLDQLFVGPSTSSSTSSSSSSSTLSPKSIATSRRDRVYSNGSTRDPNGAHALLSRKMSQFVENDAGGGVKEQESSSSSSSRSVASGSKGRERAASSTSSNGTTTTIREDERNDEDEDVESKVKDTKGKGKEVNVPTVSPLKRNQPSRSRTTSSASSISSSRPRFNSTSNNRSTTTTTAPLQPPPPLPSTSTSSSTTLSISPSQGFLSTPKRWIVGRPSSTSFGGLTTTKNNAVDQSSKGLDSKGVGEVGTNLKKDEGGTINEMSCSISSSLDTSASSPPPLAIVAPREEDRDSSQKKEKEKSESTKQSQPSTTTGETDSNVPPDSYAPSPSLPGPPTTTTTASSSTPRGWISLFSGGRYGGSSSEVDRGGEVTAEEGEVKRREEVNREREEMETDEMNVDDVGKDDRHRHRIEGDVESQESIETNNDTLRDRPVGSEEYDSNTLTPRTVRPSRSSWWLWGSYGENEGSQGEEKETTSTVTNDEVDQTDEQPPTQNEQAVEEPVPIVAQDVDVDDTPSNVTRSWIQTIWGESDEELAARRKREARAFKLAINNNKTSGLRIEGSGERKMIEGTGSEGVTPSTSVVTTASFPGTSSSSSSSIVAQPLDSTTTKTIRPKSSSSWAIFTRANPGVEGTSPQKGSGGLLASLGVTSSSASTRSRTSSHRTESASQPPSPQLRAQPDGPVKPLTGSIRASTPTRQRPTAPLEPDPPFENLVLPTFNDSFLRPPRSFPPQPKNSTLTRAVSVVSAYLFSHPPAAPTSPPTATSNLPGTPIEIKDDPAKELPKALQVVGEPSRLSNVKRVVTIGVHGWFPHARLKSVLGEPTGTSVKFATMMHDAVQSYLESHDVSSYNIQAIALEGEGLVEDRVNKLHSQLIERQEWVEALLKADVVFLATHSQGSVVSTQLLARMLDQGLVVGTRTHLLVMCGIAQGPFVYLYQSVALAPYFNYVESAAARELFEFQDPESIVAIKFLESLRLILNAGIKVTTVGSINDQVVPLYSSLFSGVSHPAILRAVFIDSDAFHTSDFLANLVVFSARLRNAGLSDHDLVYHVSEALAGALTGVGHSKIYEEAEVFNLAVRHQFETTSLTESPTNLDPRLPPPPLSMSFNPRDRRNPYLLTWALRGIIEDPHVRQLFGNELKALGEAYVGWKPTTRVLKDVKLKLEGIRMINRTAGKL